MGLTQALQDTQCCRDSTGMRASRPACHCCAFTRQGIMPGCHISTCQKSSCLTALSCMCLMRASASTGIGVAVTTGPQACHLSRCNLQLVFWIRLHVHGSGFSTIPDSVDEVGCLCWPKSYSLAVFVH